MTPQPEIAHAYLVTVAFAENAVDGRSSKDGTEVYGAWERDPEVTAYACVTGGGWQVSVQGGGRNESFTASSCGEMVARLREALHEGARP